MNILIFDKDTTSFKNAILYAFVHLLSAAALVVVSFLLILPFEGTVKQVVWKIIAFVIIMLLAAVFFMFFGYCLWYILVTLFTSSKQLGTKQSKDKKAGSVIIKNGKKNTIEIDKKDVEFISAKELWSPIKGIDANLIEIHLKNKTVYKRYFFDSPGEVKAAINALIKEQTISK